eukprot:gene3019-13042_t
MSLINYPSCMLAKLALGCLPHAAGSFSQAVGAFYTRQQGPQVNGPASTSRSVSTDSVEEPDLPIEPASTSRSVFFDSVEEPELHVESFQPKVLGPEMLQPVTFMSPELYIAYPCTPPPASDSSTNANSTQSKTQPPSSNHPASQPSALQQPPNNANSTKPEMKYMSRPRQMSPQAPFQRKPIYFPDISLEMMKLDEATVNEIKTTGWTREVAFKTTPNVTKLEIKAFLESVYGMQVEKVNTINYLGKKYTTYGRQKIPKMYSWRDADWKKAYVIFSRPKGLEETGKTFLESSPQLSMIDQLRLSSSSPLAIGAPTNLPPNKLTVPDLQAGPLACSVHPYVYREPCDS